MADAAYGLWPLVVLNTLLFVVFAASFFHPKTKRDWRAMGAYGAFMVALFTEMYGTPLTIYLLGSWLGSRFPLLKDSHAGGHLWNDLTNWQGDPHLSPFHLASYVAIGVGFWLIAAAWKVLHEAAQKDRLATTGPYGWVRHPQYDGFLLIMIGFLLQWPTIPTLIMFPVLVYVYVRLARSEEREVAKQFGEQWTAYAANTPAFWPKRPRKTPIPRKPGTSSTHRSTRGADSHVTRR
ncbi:isoprenylcysteine carboxylmethyltransferase family protein [Streptomyces sp. CdTB01]|uniref:methyltransferase family protein n=1 Tax=Streptomyces sp. CdTB01 TaxID=1725411 RepID=UPI00073AB220|nr:isoprenylcysteine carboxylmethyltransferase family protein [Streptomyces sp. CdTB01]ALV33227.1 isoprenylcysteine carboxyl methyltransferase [Streptomyces sp. CdTB01]